MKELNGKYGRDYKLSIIVNTERVFNGKTNVPGNSAVEVMLTFL